MNMSCIGVYAMLQPNVIKDHYPRVISEIMAERGVAASGQPNYVVAPDTELPEVLRYTDWYVAGRGDSRSHYRYDRYMSGLQSHPASERRQAHVDIGCGAGLFSWVFLDWATENSVGYDRVDLYGLDHCQAMLDLAEIARSKLLQYIPNYPSLRFCRDVDSILLQLTEHRREDTDYIITFGHVLIQAHSPENINDFTQIVVHINELKDAHSNLILVPVDAFSGNRPAEFSKAWKLLSDSLEQAGIRKSSTVRY